MSHAEVTVDDNTVGQIEQGLLVFLGVSKTDAETDINYTVDKLSHLRIFADDQGKMNRSVQDVSGSILLISNFTLYGDCRKGRRPGFDAAGPPDKADTDYEKVASALRERGIPVETGQFQAHMHVSSLNDGPVTFVLDSEKIL